MSPPNPDEDLVSESAHDGAYLLQWAGIALCGYFLATSLAAAWPVALLQNSWQLRIATSLINGGIFPLVGASLICLAQLINPEDDGLQDLMRRVRVLAVLAALGFFLLIPLQTAAGLRQVRSGENQVRQRLQRVSKASDAIEKATTADELRAAILQVPGIESPRLPATFSQQIPEVRTRLLEVLRPRIKALENDLQMQMRQIWQQWLVKTARDDLMAGFMAIGFAAVARPREAGPPLLWTLSRSLQGHGWRRRRHLRKATSSRVLGEEWLEGLEDENDSDRNG